MELLNQQMGMNRNGLLGGSMNLSQPDPEIEYEEEEDSEEENNNAPMKKIEKAKWTSDEV